MQCSQIASNPIAHKERAAPGMVIGRERDQDQQERQASLRGPLRPIVVRLRHVKAVIVKRVLGIHVRPVAQSDTHPGPS